MNLHSLVDRIDRISEWQAAVAGIGRGLWALMPFVAGAPVSSFTGEAWTPLGYIFPVLVILVGVYQAWAIKWGGQHSQRWACMAAIVSYSFAMYLFLGMELRRKTGVPLLPVYLSFVVAGAIRFIQLGKP